MAVYTSVDSVLKAVEYKVKVFNDILKDPVAKTILQTSPPVARYFFVLCACFFYKTSFSKEAIPFEVSGHCRVKNERDWRS